MNHFDLFIKEILPKINKKFILITSQCHLPQIQKNEKTDSLLKNNKIVLWISTNPIYNNNIKYMAFPYGIYPKSVHKYDIFLKKKKKY